MQEKKVPSAPRFLIIETCGVEQPELFHAITREHNRAKPLAVIDF